MTHDTWHMINPILFMIIDLHFLVSVLLSVQVERFSVLLGRFSLKVAISVCVLSCVLHAIWYGFLQGLSLALRSHDQFPVFSYFWLNILFKVVAWNNKCCSPIAALVMINLSFGWMDYITASTSRQNSLNCNPLHFFLKDLEYK